MNLRTSSRPTLRIAAPLLAGAMLIAVSPAQMKEPVKSVPDVSVAVSGSPVEFRAGKPMMQDASVLVPFRAVLQKMGANVSYDAKTRLIVAKQAGRSVQLTPGSRGVEVDGRRFNVTVAPKEIGGTVYIPLRFVGEALGAKVMYDKATSAVNIDPGKAAPAKSEEPMTKPETQPAQRPVVVVPPPAVVVVPKASPTNEPPVANVPPVTNEPPMASEPPFNAPPVNAPPVNAPPAVEPPVNAPAPVENAPIVNAAPAPVANTEVAPAAATEQAEPTNLSWLPWLLGALVLAAIAVAGYLVLKNNRAGQVIASSDDSKKN